MSHWSRSWSWANRCESSSTELWKTNSQQIKRKWTGKIVGTKLDVSNACTIAKWIRLARMQGTRVDKGQWWSWERERERAEMTRMMPRSRWTMVDESGWVLMSRRRDVDARNSCGYSKLKSVLFAPKHDLIWSRLLVRLWASDEFGIDYWRISTLH